MPHKFVNKEIEQFNFLKVQFSMLLVLHFSITFIVLNPNFFYPFAYKDCCSWTSTHSSIHLCLPSFVFCHFTFHFSATAASYTHTTSPFHCRWMFIHLLPPLLYHPRTVILRLLLLLFSNALHYVVLLISLLSLFLLMSIFKFFENLKIWKSNIIASSSINFNQIWINASTLTHMPL